MEQSQETKDHKLLGTHVSEDEKNGHSSSNNLGSEVIHVKTSDIIGNTEDISEGDAIATGSSSPEDKDGLSIPSTVSVSKEQSKVQVSEELQESRVCSSPTEIYDKTEGMAVGDFGDSSQCGYAIGEELNCDKGDSDGTVDNEILREEPSDEFHLVEPTEECEEPSKNVDSVQSILPQEDDMPTETVLEDIQKVLNENENCPEDSVDGCPKSVVLESEQPAQIEKGSRCKSSAAHTVLDVDDSKECVDSVVPTSMLDEGNLEEGEDLNVEDSQLDKGDSEVVETSAPHTVLVKGDAKEEETSSTHKVLDMGDSEEMETSATDTVLDTCISEKVTISTKRTVSDKGELAEVVEEVGSLCEKSHDVDKPENSEINSGSKEPYFEDILSSDDSLEATASGSKSLEPTEERLVSKELEASNETEVDVDNKNKCESVQIETESNVQSGVSDEDIQNVECGINNEDSPKGQSEVMDEDNQRDYSDSEKENIKNASPALNSVEVAENDAVSSVNENELLVEDVSVDSLAISPKMDIANSDINEKDTIGKDTDSDVINNEDEEKLLSEETETLNVEDSSEKESHGHSNVESENDVDDGRDEYLITDNKTGDCGAAGNGMQENRAIMDKKERVIEKVTEEGEEIKELERYREEHTNELDLEKDKADSPHELEKDKADSPDELELEKDKGENSEVLEKDKGKNSDELESEKDKGENSDELKLVKDRDENSDVLEKDKGENSEELEDKGEHSDELKLVKDKDENSDVLEKDKGKHSEELMLVKDKSENSDLSEEDKNKHSEELELERDGGENSEELESVKDKGENSDDLELEKDKDENSEELESVKNKGENSDDLELEKDKDENSDELELEKDKGENLDVLELEKDKGENLDELELEKDKGENLDEVELENDKGENLDELELEKDKGENSDELEKDKNENSDESEKYKEGQFDDMQDNVEFVQIDSDKDESSQHSLGKVLDESTKSAEEDPIAVSTDKDKDDTVVDQESNEQAMEVDDAVDLDSSTGSAAEAKTAEFVDEPESVDISLMCETVLEESSTYVTKQLGPGDDAADIVEIIESDLGKENERQKGSSKSKSVGTKVVGKTKGADSVSRKQANTNSLADEEICIIPDTVPRVIPGAKESKSKAEQAKGKKTNKPSEVAEKAKEKSLEVQKDGKETRRTPGRPQRQAAKRAECQIKEIADEERQETEDHISGIRMCDGCFKLRSWVTSLKLQENGTEKVKYFCSHDCLSNFKRNSRTKPNDSDVNSNAESVRRIARKCAQCSSLVTGDEKNLSWETMDYCNEDCLGRYQKILGSQCANCRGTVASPSLGKYCVRFGYDVKQFCCSTCLEEFKKGLKVCSYCQKDISGGAEGFLAPVGDKGQFKDFCTQSCMEKYDQMSNNHAPPVVVQECAVCNNEKVVSMEVIHKKRVNKFCSEPCFAAFRFVNGMISEQCYMCKKYFDKKEVDNFGVYSDDVVHCFCSKTCMNVYILANRKIVPCHWCKVKKYNFDMIKRVYSTGQLLLVCSLNCLSLYQYGANTVTTKRIKCDMCAVTSAPQYNLNMSDNSVRNFCSYVCVMKFQEQFTNAVRVDSSPFPTGVPKRYVGSRRSLAAQQNETQRENVSGSKTNNNATLPVISSVESLANNDSSTQNNAGITTRSGAALKQVNNNVSQNATQTPKVVRQIIVRPPVPKPMRNKAVTCRPSSHTKGTHCRPIISTKETQTETSGQDRPILIPVPVPIYVPSPMCMYSSAFPVPVPFPLPVPVPVFIPTTRNSMKGIMKEIKRIQEKIPIDPFEAEILMMAEIVAGQKKEVNSDSDSDAVDNVDAGSTGNGADVEEEVRGTTTTEGEQYTPETVDASNTFGDDMLQMALKMATELEEPTDLEAALTPSTITTQPTSNVEQTNSESEDDPEPLQPAQEARPQRGRKRPVRAQRNTSTPTTGAASAPNKRRRVSTTSEPLLLPPPEPSQPGPVVEQEKPDANMCLKYTLGVNAWKRWVLTKNAELEKAAANNRKLKLFKTEILQQTADELNYSLCLFVKEVRKPNGQEYAPDTIYYLCLGIQQYLFESGRIDNIFTDPYYEKFTECLDEVAKKFSTLYNDSQYIVTRVEEEHLWESKQLGAHSPHVLLSTLMFFNTKHFNLTTVDEHMQLSFSHIMKHWKRNPNQSGGSKGPGSSRNVLLRFYPPQSALESNSKKKKVYEQQENEENPLRCPVKLYEFYLSKCPESVKTRNDVFYLLPERSCVPDSPVWYSTMALGKEPLMKMLHRVKMVKEINQALLKS